MLHITFWFYFTSWVAQPHTVLQATFNSVRLLSGMQPCSPRLDIAWSSSPVYPSQQTTLGCWAIAVGPHRWARRHGAQCLGGVCYTEKEKLVPLSWRAVMYQSLKICVMCDSAAEFLGTNEVACSGVYSGCPPCHCLENRKNGTSSLPNRRQALRPGNP